MSKDTGKGTAKNIGNDRAVRGESDTCYHNSHTTSKRNKCHRRVVRKGTELFELSAREERQFIGVDRHHTKKDNKENSLLQSQILREVPVHWDIFSSHDS